MKVPNGWSISSIADLVTIREGQVSPLKEPYSTQLHVGPENIASGGGLRSGLKTCRELGLKSGKYRFTPGAIIYSKIRPNLNKVCLVDFEGVCSADAYPLYAIPTKSEPRFLLQVLRGPQFLQQAISVSVRSGMPKINREDLNCIELPIPPLPEQCKIADILSTWDEALSQLDALIEAKERRKKALLQQLLSGKRRLPGFKGKWKTVSLGDVLEPITRPTAKPQGKFLAAGIRSHGKGVFLKHDFIPANIALDELFELKAGDLVVNITFAWEGAAAIVPPEADGALVSHRFPTYGFRDGKSDRSFFRHYIRTKRFVFDCGIASPGGAGRNRVLGKSAFLGIELSLPPNEEQQAIGSILDTADQQLTLLRNQRTALDQQKRGLMQRLLTGRLKVQL
jgi:type I restriction enzyme S subunit